MCRIKAFCWLALIWKSLSYFSVNCESWCSWVLGLGVETCGFPELASGREWSSDMPRKLVLFSICDCRCFWPLIQDSLWVTLLSEQSCVGEHLNNCLGVYNWRVFWEGHVTPGAYCVTARIQGFGDLMAGGAVTNGAENNGTTWIWILPEAWV